MFAQVLARRPAIRAATARRPPPAPRRCPMPDNSSNCGELNEPPQRMTSFFARKSPSLAIDARAHADRALSFKQDTADEGARFQNEVRPAARRIEIGHACVAAHAFARVELEVAAAVAALVVVVYARRNAGCGHRIQKCVGQRSTGWNSVTVTGPSLPR